MFFRQSFVQSSGFIHVEDTNILQLLNFNLGCYYLSANQACDLKTTTVELVWKGIILHGDYDYGNSGFQQTLGCIS